MVLQSLLHRGKPRLRPLLLRRTIAYHTIDGVWAYCVEPNTSSLANQPYKSYRADSASSTSYWMRELDSAQRRIWCFKSDTLIDALSAALRTNATSTKAE